MSITQEMERQILASLTQENERLRRLVRFQFLTLGFYGTKYNYNQGEFAAQSGVILDGGGNAQEAMRIAEDLGFTANEITSWNGPHTCSNCTGGLKYENIYPCKCDKPNIAGIDMKGFRKW